MHAPTEKETFLAGYLHIVAQAGNTPSVAVRMRDQGFAYTTPEAYVLAKGQLWHRQGWTLPDRVKLMTPKHCFDNAYRLATRRKGLRYVEGYYATSILPLPHAWCVDADGRVIDPTWRRLDQPPYDADVPSYFGVVFPLEVVQAARTGSDNCSVLQDWEHGYPVLRREREGS